MDNRFTAHELWVFVGIDTRPDATSLGENTVFLASVKDRLSNHFSESYSGGINLVAELFLLPTELRINH